MTLIAYRHLAHDPVVWSDVVVMYKQGNSPALRNVFYRFRKPLVVPRYPGYYLIPYFSRYAINENGDLIQLKTGRSLGWSTVKPGGKNNIKGGYKHANLKCDKGRKPAAARHRFVAMVFLEYTNDPFVYIINHKNGIPGDDRVENLEWVTRAYNHIHALENNLKPNATIKIVMKHLLTGEETLFPSIAKASLHTGMEWSAIQRRIGSLSHIHFDDHLVFKLHDQSPWPELTVKKKAGFLRKIIALNIFTKELKVFMTAKHAERIVSVSSANVLRHCLKENPLPTMGWLFRYYGRDIVWPTFNDKQLAILKKYPKDPPSGVVAHDEQNLEVFFFESVREAAQHFSLSVNSLDGKIRRGSKVNDLTLQYVKV